MAAITYPSVRRDESAVDDHYGQQVADPYRWLEDPDSEETGQFVKNQNAVTMPYLEGCEGRSKFHARYSCHTYMLEPFVHLPVRMMLGIV